VIVEVLFPDYDCMLAKGASPPAGHKHVVVKLPTTREGNQGIQERERRSNQIT